LLLLFIFGVCCEFSTLTQGKPEVTDVTLFTPKYTLEEFLFFVGSAELQSEHVLGKTLVSYARSNPATAELVQPQEFKATSGKGLACLIGSHRVSIGNRACMAQAGVAVSLEVEQTLVSFENLGRIALCISIDSLLVAVVAMADIAKPEAASIIRHLESMGVQVWMCTGDNSRTALALAAQIGLPHERVVAEALPEDKYELVKKLQEQYKLVVAMIGDGINDSCGIAQSDLGFSVGAGTDVAMEAADIILVKNDLRDVLVALDLSRATLRRIKLNFLWALGYNLIGIPVAAGFFYPAIQMRLPPELAALAMALSSVSVITSSLWLKRYKRPVIKRTPDNKLKGKNRSAQAETSISENEEVELVPHQARVTSKYSLAEEEEVKFHLSARASAAGQVDDEDEDETQESLLKCGQEVAASSNGALDEIDPEHEECCPCGCECGQLALARNEARRRKFGASSSSSSSSAQTVGSTQEQVPSCCSPAPSSVPSGSQVTVHLAEGITQQLVIDQGLLAAQKILKQIGCACSCSSCACTTKT
jgi:soluble P-type ATPase